MPKSIYDFPLIQLNTAMDIIVACRKKDQVFDAGSAQKMGLSNMSTGMINELFKAISAYDDTILKPVSPSIYGHTYEAGPYAEEFHTFIGFKELFEKRKAELAKAHFAAEMDIKSKQASIDALPIAKHANKIAVWTAIIGSFIAVALAFWQQSDNAALEKRLNALEKKMENAKK